MILDSFLLRLLFIWLCVSVVVLQCRMIQGSEILCYECTSWSDPNCADPFNFTLPQIKLPPAYRCGGCCVKLVQNIGTIYESVRRTCTKRMKINLFMVDHVCMLERSGRGHMCFCEEDYCNTAPILQSSLVLSLSFLPVLTTRAMFFGCGLR